MQDGKLIAGRFPSDSVVVIAGGLDFTKLQLSSEEAYVLSRVGNGIKAGDLLASSGLPEQKADQVVRALVGKGCLVVREHPAMLEAVDLPAERKQEILALDSQLDALSPFDLLGVKAGAKAELCKAAYYELSMRFHPDRFYGKELGSFRGRIDRIFKALTEAQLSVTDPDRRAEVEAEHPEWFMAARAEAAEAVVHDGVRAEDRARRIARHPYMAKAARGREHLAKAKRALEAKENGLAVNELQLLLAGEPRNAEALALLATAQGRMAEQRGVDAFEEAVRFAREGSHARAIPRFLAALDSQATAATCAKGLDSALRVPDLKAAKVFASKWVELSPRTAKARLALAEVLFQAGLPKNAKREAEEALKLEPENKEAKALLAKVRWA